MYVLEGSRLGGILIARKLAIAGLNSLPMNFIRQGNEDDYWRKYQRWLAQFEADHEVAGPAIKSARLVFEKYLLAREMEM
ncbi:hypothetical protein ROS1_57410 [Roseibium sp. ROS1]